VRLARAFAVLLIPAALLAPRPADAYSVLAHESNIDALWASHIRPLLRQKYPRTSAADLEEARAYAYGGSVIQDLGYYPFGSALFTNLLHYVKTGDFVEALLRDARDVDEYAFAIGALCHYESDLEGHSIAINRALPLIYPKMRRKYGDNVPYEKAPKEHILTEFALDVLLVANGGYTLQAYHDFIGFQVSKRLLEEAFQDTYGLDMRDLFLSEDLAIGTFRHAVAGVIPQATRIAWDQKRDAIEKTTPGVVRDQFVLTITRADYDRDFDGQYRRPGVFAKILSFVYRLLPKIGPLRPLSFKVPTPEAERLFLDSVDRARARFRTALQELRAGHLTLANVDLDTGKPSAPGEYELADATRKDLQKHVRSATKHARSR
jgi:Zinc dependent phospholipase C